MENLIHNPAGPRTAIDKSGLPELLTISDLLKILRISRTSLWRHMKMGRIQSIKIGSRVLFEPAAVDEFITYCRQRGYIQ